MRIVHLTDLHVQHMPRIRELVPKRVVGTANLVLGGRRHHFSVAAQNAAVQAALEQAPDLVVVTGDLTAQALDSEFEAARTLLRPLAEVCPLFVIPGNHDTYVPESFPGARMRAVMGEWMAPTAPALVHFDGVSLLHLETCTARLLSAGWTDLHQFSQADRLLEDDAEACGFVFLCLHYPLRGRHGEPYGPWVRANPQAADIEAWLRRRPGIGAVLHGHEHHGFRTTVPGARGAIPVLDPGASGYAHLPDQGRTAHFNVYTVEEGILTDVERFAFDGTRFSAEPGGAYASGG